MSPQQIYCCSWVLAYPAVASTATFLAFSPGNPMVKDELVFVQFLLNCGEMMRPFSNLVGRLILSSLLSGQLCPLLVGAVVSGCMLTFVRSARDAGCRSGAYNTEESN